MSATPILNRVGLENQRLIVRDLWFKMTLVGHTTPGGGAAKMYSDTPGVYGYVEGNTLTGEDADTGFTTLDYNASPTVVGVLVACGDAVELIDFSVPAFSCVLGTGWTNPAVTVTKEGTGDDGVTTSNNISVTLSIATLDLDANISTHTFWCHCVYKASQTVSG